MNQKRVYSFVGLFIIALVISLPFYVADVYAVSVSITGNTGSEGIEGFIDAEGDVWTVEALIAGYNGTVEAEKVKVKVGGNEAEFNSCSDSAMGATCEYVSPLNDGVIEGGYDFDVLFYHLDMFEVETSTGDSDKVVADGSGPKISFKGAGVWQDKEEVKLDFSVEDEPTLCVGLDKVEIIDADSGVVLQEISGFGEGDCEFDFIVDSGGVLESSLEGEGRRDIKVKAIDRLGHESVKTKNFDTDFVAPEILDGISFVSFGEFIGQYEAETDIEVNVTESGDDLVVKGYSEQADLDGDEADCSRCYDCEEEDLWICKWKDVTVVPSESISVAVVVEDEEGNVGEKTLSKSFVVDSAAPEAVFFGTERIYGDLSYVKEGKNRIFLEVKEEGVGMSKEGIRANLAGLGGSTFDEPDDCLEVEDRFICYWDVSKSSIATDMVLIGLSYFVDKVGNEGVKPEIEVEVDTTGPRIEEVEFYGFSDTLKKNYFQSNDVLSIEMTIRESSGLLVLVNLNDIVMDAETLFPEFSYGDLGDYAGWQMFTEENCDEEEGKWKCVLVVEEAIKSGPDSSVDLEIQVYDTAGNEAEWEDEPKNIKSGSEGDYFFELLGVDVEEEPDFWEVKEVSYAPEFVDLDTTGLINTRVSALVSLRTDSDAEGRLIELSGCSPGEGGENVSSVGLTRSLMYGGIYAEAAEKLTPTIVLEFESFDGNELFGEEIEEGMEIVIPYNCQLKIYSQVGRKAVKAGEIQDVNLSVKFGFSVLGAQDENLEGKIDEAREDWMLDVLALTGLLVKINTIVKIICSVVWAIDSAVRIILGAGAALGAITYTKKVGTALCNTGGAMRTYWTGLYEIVSPICTLFSCRQGDDFLKDVRNPLGDWTAKVNDFYEKAGYTQVGLKNMYDPYNSLILSIATLCIPGIIYNLEKMRQIQCRYISCLENEVGAGAATIDSCSKLRSYQWCKYCFGEIFWGTPFVGALVSALNFVISLVQSGIMGVLMAYLAAKCKEQCEGSEYVSFWCDFLSWVKAIFDLIENIDSLLEVERTIKGDYCSAVGIGWGVEAWGE